MLPPSSSLNTNTSQAFISKQFVASGAPSILLVGATGNTGHSTSNALSNHRMIAPTRSLDSPAAKQLAKLPGIEMIEKNWVEITAEWLQEHEVARAFIASHNNPTQLAEESTYVAALDANVKYVVRISTTTANVRPEFPMYYPRSHCAIESLLGSPEFATVEFIRNYRETEEQDTLRLMASEDAPVGVIDSDDVETFAAHLLALEDPAVHNRAKYNLNWPEDITGAQVLKMIEQRITIMVKDSQRMLILSIKRGAGPLWDGKCTSSLTSKEVSELVAPRRTPNDVFKKTMLDEQ
ncbi:hypothetical protein BJX63DRAFT_417855 [Aspergillus granulosus]|uniref:NmrA-like domain-containing protein n=1 Tax=Aspergillus granulosus TaxID=176169 RepID=A0ABR4I2X1_9EURO